MINKTIHRPKIMSDAFSRNMAISNRVVEGEFMKAIEMGYNENDAYEVVAKKYGRKAAEKVSAEARAEERALRGY